MVPLKYLCNFWRTLKMPLINCEISLQLTWSEYCYFSCNRKNKICNNRSKTLCSSCNFTEDNIKLLKQLESGFKKEDKEQSRYFDYLIDPSFQEVNIFFVLSFENRSNREVHTKYYIPKVEIKDYVIIDGRNFFDQPTENNLKTYDNIRKIATVQRHDYSTGCLLDYPYFRETLQAYCNRFK